MATKKELQDEYQKLYGEKPNSKLTKAQLEDAISNKSDESPEQAGSKKYVSDPSLLKKVEGVRMGLKSKGKDGKITGGTEYFGEPKNK